MNKKDMKRLDWLISKTHRYAGEAAVIIENDPELYQYFQEHADSFLSVTCDCSEGESAFDNFLQEKKLLYYEE